MPDGSSTGRVLLEFAYDALDLRQGDLVDVQADGPRSAHSSWAALASRVGAERLFFVDDDPVVVFSALQGEPGDLEILEAYRRTWCLAQPRCLFLAVGDELRVYALSQLPERDRADKLRALEVVRRTSEVAQVLASFTRERLETGVTFSEPAFQKPKGRADARLLRDVRSAETALMEAGLPRRRAHDLIERAILVRYLEDREVLTPGYFEELAEEQPGWTATLDKFEAPLIGAASRFATCLDNPSLTAALFERLARDFNGDLFVECAREDDAFGAEQLAVLRDLLLGVDGHGQGQLFLWAYDFSVVPTSLISSMYELFYRRETAGTKTSTYYTPVSLVEFVLSSVLPDNVLETEPVVCDPACGSGVFLVEAFRRIARFEAHRHSDRLSSAQLRDLLITRVRGVDIDEDAIRLAAFSLYLAFLDMQSPPDIRRAGRLPPLISSSNSVPGERPLSVADAFADGALPDNAFDVVVANPPWTEPRAGAAMSTAESWAAAHDLPYGDNNPSQLFMWRTLHLLRDGGKAALLIGAGALLNVREPSKRFRRRFLSQANLEHVTALWPVRSDFFVGAKAPFAYVRFGPDSKDDHSSVIVFDTATRGGPRDGSLTFLPVKRRFAHPSQLVEHDFLWKTMTQGGRRDAQLVLRLSREQQTLQDLIAPENPPRYGWQRVHAKGTPTEPTPKLQQMQSIKKLESWGPLKPDWLVPLPSRVTWEPHHAALDGRRLLVDMGITAEERLHARVVNDRLGFDHNIWALPLQHLEAWEADVALGVLLSSTGRYYLSMTSGLWGVGHDQIRKAQLLKLPIRFTSPTDEPVLQIRRAVEQLQHAEPDAVGSLLSSPGFDANVLLSQIDAAVFNLFELADFERDLVADHWLERTEQKSPSLGLTLQVESQSRAVYERYAATFCDAWRPLLGPELELSWRVHSSRETRTLAIVFSLHAVEAPPQDIGTETDWRAALGIFAGRVGEVDAGLRTFGMARIVTDNEIILVKRDEPDLWTATAARDDAEASSVQLTVARDVFAS